MQKTNEPMFDAPVGIYAITEASKQTNKAVARFQVLMKQLNLALTEGDVRNVFMEIQESIDGLERIKSQLNKVVY